MNFFKIAALGLCLAGGLTAHAHAQGEAVNAGDWKETTLRMVSPSGKVSAMKMTDPAMVEMLMKEATPLAGNVMLFLYQGKMYMVADKKMPDGRMISQMLQFSTLN